jgi:hypothetical protein
MTDRPDWLDDETAHDVAGLFREHGVPEGVSIIPASGGDEAIFLISSDSAARVGETAITTALMERLRRKVWITTDASAWREAPIPLVRPDDRIEP